MCPPVSTRRDAVPIPPLKPWQIMPVPEPTAVTGVQMREAVVGWAKSHPDVLRRQASGVVLRALHDLYKCSGSQGGVQE